MRSILLIAFSFMLCGCALFRPPVSIVEGTTSYIPLPAGYVMKAVPMNLDGNGVKLYDIKLVKSGAFYDTQAEADVMQARKNR